jgi:transcriptional regulator of arginine metabolism
MSKARRQHRISALLQNHSVTNQVQLVELLEREDIVATQATVSRDLDELGAIKVRVPGGETVYAIPEHPVDRIAPEEHLRRVMGDWVADIGTSANIVMLRTPPGSAHVVASALDRAGIEDILGTVAGDDTLLVVAAESIGGAALADRLRDLAGL